MGQAIGKAMDIDEWFFPAVPPSYDGTHEDLVRFKTEAGGEVPAMLLVPAGQTRAEFFAEGGTSSSRCSLGEGASSGSQRTPICVIYFHPNACDIGHSIYEMEVIRDLVLDGSAVVVAPEYPGYGLLTSYEPSPRAIDRVAEAAWAFCTNRLHFHADQIILWGRSIGTGPASALARKLALGQLPPRSGTSSRASSSSSACLGALVLVAPFVSISAAVSSHAGSLAASFVGSMWKVADLVADPALAHVPLCVVHPDDDEIVPRIHGETVLKAASSTMKGGIWLTGEGHNFEWDEEHTELVRDFLGFRCQALAHLLIATEESFDVPEHSSTAALAVVDAARGQQLSQQLLAWGADFSSSALPAEEAPEGGVEQNKSSKAGEFLSWRAPSSSPLVPDPTSRLREEKKELVPDEHAPFGVALHRSARKSSDSSGEASTGGANKDVQLLLMEAERYKKAAEERRGKMFL